MSDAYTGHILCGSSGTSLSPLIVLLDEMKKEGRRGGERKEGGRGNSMFCGGRHTPVGTGSAASCCFSRTSQMRTLPSSEHEINCLSEQKAGEKKPERVLGRPSATEITGALN